MGLGGVGVGPGCGGSGPGPGGDGTGDGVNAAAVDALAAEVDVPVIASGGVASLDDIRKLRALGRRNLDAVIVGRAIYVGAVDLATALRVGRGLEA